MWAARTHDRRRLRRPTRLDWIAGVILFLFTSNVPGASAQVGTTHTFYPLAKGNVWAYSDFSNFVSEADDTIRATILGDTMMQGRSYTVTHWLSYHYHNSGFDYKRFDSTGDVYRFNTYYGTPQLWYRLSDTSRTVWHRDYWNVRFDSSTYRTVFGRRVRVLFVNFYSSSDSAFAHSTNQEQLAEGIGLIGVAWPEGSSRSLMGARIDGETYGIIDDVDTQLAKLPGSFELLSNFPNPFNPSTSITYRLPVRSLVDLKIFDLLGREIAALAHGWQDAGYHQRTWNAWNVPSGIYFYRLQAGEFVETKKMILIR